MIIFYCRMWDGNLNYLPKIKLKKFSIMENPEFKAGNKDNQLIEEEPTTYKLDQQKQIEH